jgi:hypothetical protein
MTVKLSSGLSTNGTFYYGQQALEAQPVKLDLRNTAPPFDDGTPMYSFRTTYDRVVLLKERDFTRWEQPAERHPSFRSGDAVWRCVFNETTIDGYIYANRTAPSGTLNNTAAAIPTLPKIPYVLKLVEQHMPTGNGAYCDKMRVQGDILIRSTEGQRLLLRLTEAEAEASAAKTELARSVRLRSRQQPGSKSCQCQWMVQ